MFGIVRKSIMSPLLQKERYLEHEECIVMRNMYRRFNEVNKPEIDKMREEELPEEL